MKKKTPSTKPTTPAASTAAPPSPTLDSETATKVLNADLINVMRKVKSGRTLTRHERALVESAKSKRPTTDPEYFDTLKAASSGLGIPIAALKIAKSAGCPAFRHGRVYTSELRRWLESNPTSVSAEPTNKDEAQLKLIIEQHRRLRIANDLKEQTSIPKVEILAIHGRILSQFREYMFARFVNELPVYTANQPVAEVRRLNQTACDELLRIVNRIGTTELGNH